MAEPTIPPPVELPAPAFVTWDQAATYARAAMARLKYVETTRVALQDAVTAAQLAQAAALSEIELLTVAANQLLAQGKDLA